MIAPHAAILAASPVLSLAPALSLWLLIPGILAAFFLTALLYKSQRLMAPRASVLFLTAIRIFLILLIAILLLQPALQWSQSRTTNGTLWLVLDQSPSMATTDPQATAIERLRWAQGMGLLTDNKNSPDQWAAQLHALSDEFHALAPDPTLGESEHAQVRAFADRIAAWNTDLQKLDSAIDSARSSLDADSPSSGDIATESLSRAQSQIAQAVSSVRNTESPADAVSAFHAYLIDPDLDAAQSALTAAAAAAQSREIAAMAASWNKIESQEKSLSRDDLVYQTLAGDAAPAFSPLQKLADHYHLRVASFAEKTQSAGTVDPESLAAALHNALTPAGTATDIAGALQYVAEQTSADEAASVIIVSDGRTNVGNEPTGAARTLLARGVHVYGLLAGSHEVSPDAAVEPVDFPEWIYKGDSVRARATIRMDGLKGQTALVELRRGEQTLEQHQMIAASDHEIIPFDFTDTPPDSAKSVDYEIRVSPMPGETNTQNNIAAFRVAVKKQKLCALFIEDRPRWEFRYLASLISRRPGLKLQTVLLEPGTVAGVTGLAPALASPDNPHEEAQILPDNLPDWQKFDVIVIGDVGPDILTPRIQQFIAACVRDNGSTLITIAGQHAMPESYSGTPLAELLPITLEPQWTAGQIASDTRSGFRVVAAPTAGFSALAQLENDPAAAARVWSQMPVWYWHSAFTRAKPAATVLWSIDPTRSPVPAAPAADGSSPDPFGSLTASNRQALLATMPVGLGHSLYLASDQTWRLRQVAGENLHDRFWGQVLNWAVGSDLPAGGKYVRFGANEPAYDQSQPVIITARILHEDLTPYTGLGFSAVARPVYNAPSATQSAGGAPPPTPSDQNSVQAPFTPMQSPGYYQATLGGLPVGDFEISLLGAEVQRLLDNDPTVGLRSVLIKILPVLDAERRNMNTDPDLLEQVAQAGGGFSLDAPYAAILFSRLPKIEHRETSIQQIGFFTDPAAEGTKDSHAAFLALFAILITMEWALRKRAGLV